MPLLRIIATMIVELMYRPSKAVCGATAPAEIDRDVYRVSWTGARTEGRASRRLMLWEK